LKNKPNHKSNKNLILKALQTVPGVGISISNDLYLMGFRSVKDFKNKDPEKLYSDFCNLVGHGVERCMLYVFRCAVYYASNKIHEPRLLLWWNWKNRN
jgi:hypothetical protein